MHTTLPRIESGRIAGMADRPHTIDRWDDATGENLIEQIAGVTDCQNNDMAGCSKGRRRR